MERKKEPYLESDLPHPLNVYGQTKLKGEQYLQERVEDHLIIRTQWLYGRHGKNFVSSILRQAREKQTLTIVNDQTGSPTYTVDLSKAIRTLIQHNSRGIFHVANREVCTWYTFGQAILKFSRIEGVSLIPISSKELSRPAVRPSYSVLNTQKLRTRNRDESAALVRGAQGIPVDLSLGRPCDFGGTMKRRSVPCPSRRPACK